MTKKKEVAAEVAAPFDLATLDTKTRADEGVWMQPEHPVTGDPVDVRIKLAGTDSDRFLEARREYAKRRFSSRKRNQEITPEEIEAQERGVLAGCVLDWEGVMYQGEQLECTEANVLMLFERLPWLFDQINEFIGTRSNFFRG